MPYAVSSQPLLQSAHNPTIGMPVLTLTWISAVLSRLTIPLGVGSESLFQSVHNPTALCHYELTLSGIRTPYIELAYFPLSTHPHTCSIQVLRLRRHEWRARTKQLGRHKAWATLLAWHPIMAGELRPVQCRCRAAVMHTLRSLRGTS